MRDSIIINLAGDVFTRCTFITPAYVFVNHTKYPICINQNLKSNDADLRVEPQERVGLEWLGGLQGR